ncbi:hypothetical protein Agub_g11837, partial [Astrephomene gubernaculifera]
EVEAAIAQYGCFQGGEQGDTSRSNSSSGSGSRTGLLRSKAVPGAPAAAAAAPAPAAASASALLPPPMPVPPVRSQLLQLCANPLCGSYGGACEGSLKLGKCSGCGGAVQYCCGECQRQHWRAGHKQECVLVKGRAHEKGTGA